MRAARSLPTAATTQVSGLRVPSPAPAGNWAAGARGQVPAPR